VTIGVVGQKSYIAQSYKKHCFSKNTDIQLINSRENAWENQTFYDLKVLVCTVGIAHVSIDPKIENNYYKINRDLPIEIAQKAKNENIKHFIFLSSMIVYGDDYPIGNHFIISQNTKPHPTNFYGKSKLEAEEALLKIADENFKVTIIRLPMVYGPGCKGNFVKLVRIAEKAPIFPSIENKRSMIFIDNLCSYLDYIIENKITGIVYPQNTEYVSTLRIIKAIASIRNRKIWYTSFFNPLIRMLSRKVNFLRKIWGTKYYDLSLSQDIEKYNIVSFEESIIRSIEGIKP
jgi:nucleoside-diphosphate-sugar epimerase